MGLLRVLRLVLVHAWIGRHVARAEALADRIARRVHRLRRHVHAIGAHVGDQSGLVQPLRGRHGRARAETELAAGLLLQRRGDERRRRVAADGAGFDRFDAQRTRGDRAHSALGGVAIGQIEALELAPLEHGQPCLVVLATRSAQNRAHRPVLARTEHLDLHLAIDDQAQAHRLHAAGRLRARQLAPQHRRELEADQVVERPAREIGAHQLHVDLARRAHRGRHGRLRDRVEHDPTDRRVLLQCLAPGQRFLQMPADRLALTVRVGRKDQHRIRLERFGDCAHVLLAVRGDLPLHLEAVLGVDRSILGRQVAHVPVGREYGVLGPEILVDGLCLGRRFDDDDGHEGLLFRKR